MNPFRSRMPDRDAIGKTAEERFEEIERHFFELLEASGVSRRPQAFYIRPKPGDAREPTEGEVVRRWAETLHISVNDICIGIQRAFTTAAEKRAVITSFRYCVPHIIARCNELRDARAGEFGEDSRPRPRPGVIDRDRARQEARRVLGGDKE
jgi:hypothetical protein